MLPLPRQTDTMRKSLLPCKRTTSALNSNGYGVVWFNGKSESAHRVAYCEHNNVQLSDIAGKVVRHECDNKWCIEGTHLLLGLTADNAQDQVDRGLQSRPPSLTIEDARMIRATYVPGNRWHPSETGQPQLAARYGVPQSVISQILRNITYKEST